MEFHLKRIRREGGGRKGSEVTHEDLNDIFLAVIEEHIAGDPMDETVRWVKLTRSEISQEMAKFGVNVSRNIIRKLLKKNGFVKRKMQRKKRIGDNSDRDRQFKKIASKKNVFTNSNNPIISIDTKKKEKLGDLFREGTVYCTKAREVNDHDYPHLATGKICPHGIYDIQQNLAYINIGISYETAEFVCDSIRKWWNQYGKKHYPDATEILILCDAGGANSYRHNIFKVELQKLANKIEMSINISHYPPYASKWNPIEHRVFPHVTRAMAGVTLNSVEETAQYIRSAKTSTGLKVKANIIKKTYKKGKEVAKDFWDKINIEVDSSLPKFNYKISPAVT